MSPHLFVDESQRGNTYLLVAAVIPVRQLARTRCLVRALHMPGERRIHFQAEHASRRRKILAALVANGTRALVYLGSGRPERVRAACLDRLVQDAIELDARRLVIESRGAADRVDRAAIHRILARPEVPRDRLTYEHLCPHDDPCLAIPDAVAWAYGAGGDWRRRVTPMVIDAVNLGAVAGRPKQREARAPVVRRAYPGSLPRPSGLGCR